MIIVIIENWARECDFKGKIAVELSKKAAQPVYLMPKNLANLLMPILPGLYFHKSLQRHINDDLAQLIARGGRYAVIDDEVIVRDIKLDHRYGVEPKHCSVVFANCIEEFQDLIDRGFPNVQLTGNPRLLPSIRAVKVQTESKPLEKILFSSNFSMIRPAGSTSVKRVVEDMKLDEEAGAKLAQFIEMHSARELKIRDYLKNLSKVLDITYRVHPIESFQKAKRAFKGSKIKVVKGGNISNDIEQHDLVLHAGCSVALDAQLVGKKSIWLYVSPEEAAGARSKLSHVYEATPTLEQLKKLFLPTLNKSDPAIIKQLMEGAAHLTREQSTSMMADALSVETKYLPKISFVHFLKNFSGLIHAYLLWMYRFATDPIEKERFDNKSINELLAYCQANDIHYSRYLGGIIKIGS